MAVLAGGSQGARVAWDQGDDNAADRVLGLQAQIGRVESWTPSQGTVLGLREGSEVVVLDVGVNVYDDGVANGTNTFTSASAPFEASMVGLAIDIQGLGRRVVTAYTSASEIEVSGPVLAAGTGLRFNTPLGIAQFTDGVTDGSNTLTSASAPFNASHVGTRVGVHAHGSRLVTAFTSATEVELDGDPLPAGSGVYFTVLTDLEPSEQSLSAGGQVVSSHRLPRLAAATVMRWNVGERRERGRPRTLFGAISSPSADIDEDAEVLSSSGGQNINVTSQVLNQVIDSLPIPQPLAYWTFDDSDIVGTTLLDQALNANGVITAASTGQPGQVRDSFEFNGSTSIVNAGDVGALAFDKSDTFSVAFWFKTDGTMSAIGNIVSKYNNVVAPGWACGLSATGQPGLSLLNAAQTAGRSRSTSADFDDSQWHHCVLTYDGSDTAAGILGYIDGVLQAMVVNGDTDPGSTVNTDDVLIGAVASSGVPVGVFDGNIDELVIWGSELSADQVQAVYKRGLQGLRLT